LGDGPCLFASGLFVTAQGAAIVVRWNGETWRVVVPYSFQRTINDMEVFDDGSGSHGLYLTRVFLSMGGTPVANIVKWNGRVWSALGSGLSAEASPRGHDLQVYDDGRGEALYVAGAFSHAGGVAAGGIARWDGLNWSPVGADLSPAPVFYEDLFAGGPAATPWASTPSERVWQRGWGRTRLRSLDLE